MPDTITTDTLIAQAIVFGLRIVIAIGIVLLGRVLARRARKAVAKFASRSTVTDVTGPWLRDGLVKATYYLLVGLAIVLALVVIGVPFEVILLVVGAALVILGLALQQSLANFAATVIFLIFQPFKRGEDIETMGVRGNVVDIQLFNTVIHMFDQRVASLPNSKIQEFGLINYSRTGINRAEIDLTVAYGEDLRKVRDIIAEIVNSDDRILRDPAPQILITQLDGDGIHVQARQVVKYGDLWPVLCDLRERIAAQLSAAGVKVAVPPVREVRVSGPALGER